MPSLDTLIPEGPYCVFYASKHQAYWGLTQNMVFYYYSALISHTQTHTTHVTYTGAKRLIHPCKYILTLPVKCSQHLSVLHWMNN